MREYMENRPYSSPALLLPLRYIPGYPLLPTIWIAFPSQFEKTRSTGGVGHMTEIGVCDGIVTKIPREEGPGG